jgi:anti-sigma factor RsiW
MDEFLKDLVAEPTSPLGDHLNDSEFTEYVLEMLPPGEVERVDGHLASCPECAIEMERLIEESSAWSGPEGEQRLEALRERVLEAARSSPGPADIILMPRAVYEPARAAAKIPAESWVDGQSEDGALSWSIEEDEAGNLDIDLSSFVLEDGARLRFRVGAWSREVVLRQLKPGEVAGLIKITRQERDSMAKDQPLQVEVVDR